MEYLDVGAFRGCTGLTSITLPSSLKSLDGLTFYGCTGLTDLTCLATTPPKIEAYDCFSSVTYSTATLHVYPSAMESYQKAIYWNYFKNITGVQYIPGDVNGDNTLSITDVTALINLLLEGDYMNDAADANGDGTISITDVTTLINRLLSGE